MWKVCLLVCMVLAGCQESRVEKVEAEWSEVPVRGRSQDREVSEQWVENESPRMLTLAEVKDAVVKAWMNQKRYIVAEVAIKGGPVFVPFGTYLKAGEAKYQNLIIVEEMTLPGAGTFELPIVCTNKDKHVPKEEVKYTVAKYEAGNRIVEFMRPKPWLKLDKKDWDKRDWEDSDYIQHTVWKFVRNENIDD